MRQGTQGRSTGTILRDGMGREVGRQFRIWRTHVHPWLIHVSVRKKTLKDCKVTITSN